MKPRSIMLIIVLGMLAIVGLAIWSFFIAYPPSSPSLTVVETDLTPTVLANNPAIEAESWPVLPGLATFGDQIKLLSLSLPSNRFTPGTSIEVSLYWQTQALTNTYNLFLHLVDANNQLLSQVDMPLTQRVCAAGSQFSAGIIVTCDSLLLPDDLAEGDYQLFAGVYDPVNGLRLPTADAENAVLLTSLEIAADALTAVACPVTTPNGSTPPGEQPSPNYHSNGQLWTVLWPDGQVIFEPSGPGSIEEDGSLGMKWAWWRSVAGQLTIEGRRLDAPAPPLRADIPKGYGESGFQATDLIFPSDGCWEVTGKVGQAELTFVTLVVKIGAGP